MTSDRISGTTACGTHHTRATLLLFCLSPSDVQWPELGNAAEETREQVALLLNAIAIDSAIHWSAALGAHAIVHTTCMCPLEGLTPLPDGIQLVSQVHLPLYRRVADAFRLCCERKDGSATALILGRNPLYPVALLGRGMELLGQEDDVVVLGEGHREEGRQSLLWLAVKGPHPEIAEHIEKQGTVDVDFLHLAADSHGLVMVLKPVPEIDGINALSYLLHEIERELLLKQWYPPHTYEILMRFRNQGVIPVVHS